MTDEMQALLMIRGTIASMPTEDQAEVRRIADSLREVVTNEGVHGFIALTLVGAEEAVEESRRG